MHTTDLLPVGEIARRSGFAESAVRYYERLGLLSATRTAGGQRRFERSTLRRLAFIRAARNVGLSLDEVADALASLPAGRTPTRTDWSRLSRGWRRRWPPCLTRAPPRGRTGPGCRARGGIAWTSRSPRSSGCATGSTRASAAAACH